MQQLDSVAHHSHHDKTNTDGSDNFHIFWVSTLKEQYGDSEMWNIAINGIF